MIRGYSDETHELILEIERVNLRKEYVFDVPKITEILKEAYLVAELPMPQIQTCVDITDKIFFEAAWEAAAPRAAWAAGAARAAGAAKADRAVWAAWASGASGAAAAAAAPRAARAAAAARTAVAVGRSAAAGVDYDFDYFVQEFEYLKTNTGNDNDRKALKLYSLFFEAKKAGLGYFAEKDGVLYICPNPIIYLNKANQFHRDGGPSIEWIGGLKLYHLNDINVPEYLVMTPAGKLTIEQFNKETNADVKAEFIKKFGFERMKSLGKSIDIHTNYDNEWYTKSEYELIDMADVMRSANFDAKYAPYLWMRNLTTGTYHMEGVSPECRTIEDALNFRMGKKVGERQAYVIGGIR